MQLRVIQLPLLAVCVLAATCARVALSDSEDSCLTMGALAPLPTAYAALVAARAAAVPNPVRPPSSPTPQIRNFKPEEVLQRIAPGLTDLGYTSITQLGSGGIGAVFEAKDPQGRPVVIKALLSDAQIAENRLDAEDKVMTELADAEKDLSRKYFVVPVDGAPVGVKDPTDGRIVPITISHKVFFRPGSDEPARSLATFDDDYFQKNPAHRDQIEHELFEAIKRLHNSEKGYIHRDLKPENVLVYYDEKGIPHIKLIDLGIAAPTRGVPYYQAGFMPFSRPGFSSGTLGYMSPSQMRGQAATPKNDVFALRRILWFMRRGPASGAQDGLVQRYLIPNQRAASGGLPQPEPLGDKFKEPSVALDFKDTKGNVLKNRDRMIAMAEFSNWPETIEEYETLLNNAKTMSLPSFLQWYAPKLMDLDSQFLLNRGPYQIRYNAAREFLNGTFLTASLTTDYAPPMTREDLNAVIRGAYLQYMQTREAAKDATVLGVIGPHQDLRFNEFFNTVKKLHEQGKIESPNKLFEEAKAMYQMNYSWY